MRKVSVSDLRYEFNKIERRLHRGEEVQITKRGRVIARLVPESTHFPPALPDFWARVRAIYGHKVFQVSGADLISADRSVIESLTSRPRRALILFRPPLAY